MPKVCVIVPEGDLPERDRRLALRAVALCLDRLDNQGGRGLCLGAEKKLEARKMPDAKRAAELPASSARCVGQFLTDLSICFKDAPN